MRNRMIGRLAPMPSDLDQLEVRARSCTACRLAESRTNVVFHRGDPRADVAFVGEGPGAEEDRQGAPFVGRSGQLLDRLVAEELGLSRDQFYVCNVVNCRPPGNRDPLPDEIEACRPFLDGQLGHVRPRVVVTLGNFASKALLGTNSGITKLRGAEYPYGDAVLIPTFHPAAALRGGGQVLAQMRADLVRAKRALARARGTPAAEARL
jgi:DNA polymerase